VLCSRCGRMNPADQDRCQHCGARLYARVSGQGESVELQPFLGVDDYLLDKLSSVERQAHRSSEDVDLLVQAMDYLERNVMVTRAGISVLAGMLREKGLFDGPDFQRRWRERARLSLVEVNRKERFLERKGEVLEGFTGKARRRFEELISRAEDLFLGLQSSSACVVLEEALGLDVANAPLNALLGQFRLGMGETAKAREHLERALKAKSPPRGSRTAAAVLLLKEEKDGEALRLLEKALQADPSDSAALTLSAFARGRGGRWAACAELADRALAAQEGAAPRYLKVHALLKLGRAAEADAEVDALLVEYPECEPALVQKLLLLLHRGWWRRAEDLQERLRAVEPAGRWEGLAAAFREAGRARRERMRLLPLSLETVLDLMNPEADEARLYLREVEGDL